MSLEKIGQRIREERIKQNLSQFELAEKADLSEQHMSNIELSKSNIGVDTLIKISNALNVTSDALLCDYLNCANNHYDDKIHRIIADSKIEEARIILDVIEVLKKSLDNQL